ncbi:uncharacterized protein LOC119775943 [Cyprinodon tularosa]|uniref:uncharacterized protein LOC119775943 n=1 Tax=Cyprinodon tularosa TaxID=77115 RepID=UPI0018E25B7F|nr:uncharacterized protein LOC119775943 [Cyprinodon tularosa]
MQNLEDDGVLLHSLRAVTSLRLSREESLEQEQVDQRDPDQEQIDNGGILAKLSSIEFRMQQLQSRRFLLMKMKRHRRKDERHSGGSSEELIIEDDEDDDDDDDELRTIQTELEDLQAKKEELERAGGSLIVNSNEVPREQLPTYKETPRGGIYMLPPPPPPPEEVTAATPDPAEDILPVERLGMAAGVTKCPSCEEVVVTETQSTASETMWILCFVCSLMGCVAGCCLIPFYMKSLRNVSHHCPRCQAKIHTHKLL